MKIQCPSCKQRVDASSLKKIAKLFPFDGAMSRKGENYVDGFMDIISKYPSFYQWACDKCLSSQLALLANPKKQFYTFKYPWDTATPYLAYFDKNFTCKNCNEHFLFSKEEQQHWFEKLSFVVYAKPLNCKDCRKELRAEKNLNTELSNLLKEGKPKDKAKLERIAAIYEAMGKTEKMKACIKAAAKILS